MFGAIVLVAMALVVIYYYPLLPDPMPSHFDIHGNANGWMRRESFIIMMAATFIFVYFLLTFLPFIDPLRKKIEPKFKVVLFLRDAFFVFFAVIFSLSLEAARAGRLQVDSFGIALGVLFVVLGNYMPRLPQNWFIGIKTPWTISSEIVWKKTHILGGWLFTLSGAVFIVYGLLDIGSIIPFATIIFTALFTTAYSFYAFKKIEKQRNAGGDKS
jgi:uncharacterized membrane protein